jgi:hypothetical protein
MSTDPFELTLCEGIWELRTPGTLRSRPEGASTDAVALAERLLVTVTPDADAYVAPEIALVLARWVIDAVNKSEAER